MVRLGSASCDVMPKDSIRSNGGHWWPDARRMPSPVVLVVEDQPLLRVNAILEIENAGFEVLEAWDADEAIRILEARSDVRIVFNDIEMPGRMDGKRLAACVRDRWPPIEIILTSAACRPDDLFIPDRALFFSKPTDWPMVTLAMRRFAGLA